MITLALTISFTTMLLAWRHGLRVAKKAWRGLHWWEKVLLILCLAPIPGPVDEIAGAWLIARGLKRLR